jgi:hypothetical protein
MSKSARTPPGFIKAKSELPLSGAAVAAHWASAIKLPKGFSPEGTDARVMEFGK